MKKNRVALILAVVATPVLADEARYQPIPAPPTVETSAYTLEVKEDDHLMASLHFVASQSETTNVHNWMYPASDTDKPKRLSGFRLTLRPVLNSQDVMGVSFEYRQPPETSVSDSHLQPTMYTLDTSMTLAKGSAYCTALSSTGKPIEFCLSRH